MFFLQYVEKMDLLGLDFLWRVCLECPFEEVAELAIGALVKFSYLAVSVNLKKDVKALHSRFVTECYKRLIVSLCSVVDIDRNLE